MAVTYPVIHNTYIEVDEDTTVGYSFLESEFYVTNKGTTTYRTTAAKIKQVLDIVSPSTASTITVTVIQSFAESLEGIVNLYYTWEDTGAYVKTVQFNEYDKYPLTLDAEKKKLYIMNTDVVYDLTLTERKQDRCSFMINYYRTHMGISITQSVMEAIYDMFITYYKPYCYNEIDSTTLDSTLKYNDTFSLSNYRGTSVATYTCQVNPDEEYTYSNIANILKLGTSNDIYLTDPVPSTLEEGSTILINGTTKTEDSYSYTSDGTYTIKSIDTTSNKIVTNEQIPNSYEPPKLYLNGSMMTISSINRDTSTITLSATVLSSIQVGDKIYISGTQQAVEGETVTCDGEYTVSSISGSTLIVQEVLSTNFSGSGAIISKHVYKGEISEINVTDKTITLVEAPTLLSAGNQVITSYNGIYGDYTISSISGNVITLTSTPTALTYPQLQIPVASTNILISVDYSKNETILPTGDFIVDNFTQCKSYLGTYSGLEVPKDSNYAAVEGKVPTAMSVTGVGVDMELKGVYSRVYN